MFASKRHARRTRQFQTATAEVLETRRLPAITFIGGWGAASYQYDHPMPGESAATDGLVSPTREDGLLLPAVQKVT